jgi:putative tricarboxylic transport membrane protein
MNRNDCCCGLILLAIGCWIAWESHKFPLLAGMPYGPGLFPTIAAVGLSCCGLLIFISSLIPVPDALKIEKQEKIEGTSYRPLINALCVIAAVIFYALFLETAGFHLVSFIVLFFLFILLQVKWFLSFILAVTITIGVHLIFYSFLHVPLPWGVLEPFAW